jgi:hypothetical protein
MNTTETTTPVQPEIPQKVWAQDPKVCSRTGRCR